MHDLTVEISDKEKDFEVYIKGEIDLNNINQIENILDEGIKQCKNIIIDMKDVRFIDSTGIGLLVKTYKALKSEGKTIEIRNAVGNVRKVFKITCLEDVFNMGVE